MSKFRISFGILWLVLFYSFMFQACECDRQKMPANFEKDLKKIYKAPIAIPDNLLLFPKGYFHSGEKDTTLVVYINGECFTCFDDLVKWKKIVEDHPDKYNYLFVVQSADTANTLYYLRKWNIDFPVYIDTAYMFLKQNYVSQYKLLQAFLLDKSNKVHFVGNPLYSENVKNRLFPSGE